MSSSDVEVRKFRANNDICMAIHDPDATTAVAITDPRTASLWFDMKDFQGFALSLLRTVGTGSLSALIFQASKVAAGTSPQTIKTIDLTGIDPDAVGDFINVEIDAQDITQAIADLGLLGQSNLNEYRYIAPVLTIDTLTDEMVATCIRTRPDYPSEDLSPNDLA